MAIQLLISALCASYAPPRLPHWHHSPPAEALPFAARVVVNALISDVDTKEKAVSRNVNPEVEKAVGSLAATTLALLAGDETAASEMVGHAAQKRELIRTALAAYDDCRSGTLSYEEACALFTRLS
eukprot:6807304-Prymnesium_polylepis.1